MPASFREQRAQPALSRQTTLTCMTFIGNDFSSHFTLYNIYLLCFLNVISTCLHDGTGLHSFRLRGLGLEVGIEHRRRAAGSLPAGWPEAVPGHPEVACGGDLAEAVLPILHLAHGTEGMRKGGKEGITHTQSVAGRGARRGRGAYLHDTRLEPRSGHIGSTAPELDDVVNADARHVCGARGGGEEQAGCVAAWGAYRLSERAI